MVQLTDDVKKKLEDNIQATWTSDIVGKSSQQNVFQRLMISRVVKLSSVCVKQLDNTFSDIHISYFPSNCLYQDKDLEVISDANVAIERQVDAGQQNEQAL